MIHPNNAQPTWCGHAPIKGRRYPIYLPARRRLGWTYARGARRRRGTEGRSNCAQPIRAPPGRRWWNLRLLLAGDRQPAGVAAGAQGFRQRDPAGNGAELCRAGHAAACRRGPGLRTPHRPRRERGRARRRRADQRTGIASTIELARSCAGRTMRLDRWPACAASRWRDARTMTTLQDLRRTISRYVQGRRMRRQLQREFAQLAAMGPVDSDRALGRVRLDLLACS